MTDSPEALHDLAIQCGAMVLGEDGTRQQYLFDLDQLRALLNPLPPCPVPKIYVDNEHA